MYISDVFCDLCGDSIDGRVWWAEDHLVCGRCYDILGDGAKRREETWET